ncbi:hypothetical protein CQA01_13430 [Cyclobacterium qasimii]|nr:hypothetical protein CQA01_13430 [Cyclobacterium qasimii]
MVAITSCNMSGGDDDDDDKIGAYMVSFKSNGVLQEFTSDHFPQGSLYEIGAQYGAGISAVRSASSFSIQVLDNKSITAKSYSGVVKIEATAESPAYLEGASLGYGEGQTSYLSASLDSDVKVAISEITAVSMRGTFSGTLKSSGEQDLVVTDGKFYVPRAQAGG